MGKPVVRMGLKRNLSLVIDIVSRDEFKRVCFLQGKTMSEVVNKFMDAYIEKYGPIKREEDTDGDREV